MRVELRPTKCCACAVRAVPCSSCPRLYFSLEPNELGSRRAEQRAPSCAAHHTKHWPEAVYSRTSAPPHVQQGTAASREAKAGTADSAHVPRHSSARRPGVGAASALAHSYGALRGGRWGVRHHGRCVDCRRQRAGTCAPMFDTSGAYAPANGRSQTQAMETRSRRPHARARFLWPKFWSGACWLPMSGLRTR